MKMYRVWAIVVRHLYNFRRSYDRLADSLYWPVMDIIVWGLSSKWMQETSHSYDNMALIVLTGLVFWQIVWRSNYEITVNLLEEFWNQNLANIFSTPLQIGEWILAVMFIGLVKNFLTIIVGVGAVYLLYSLSILAVGWWLLPFFFLLLISGWFIGFFTAGLIVYYGQKIQTLAWTMGFIFAPFSAVYYPLETLPNWAKNISMLLPMTYIFEGMREVLKTNTFSMVNLSKSIFLNILYLCLAITFFIFMFNKRKEKGLTHTE